MAGIPPAAALAAGELAAGALGEAAGLLGAGEAGEAAGDDGDAAGEAAGDDGDAAGEVVVAGLLAAGDDGDAAGADEEDADGAGEAGLDGEAAGEDEAAALVGAVLGCAGADELPQAAIAVTERRATASTMMGLTSFTNRPPLVRTGEACDKTNKKPWRRYPPAHNQPSAMSPTRAAQDFQFRTPPQVKPERVPANHRAGTGTEHA
ncbi:MAG: hypothetical protein EPO21_12115 [Chloroflexota bacterium]|nr:MAG: hypothetical protein EPO21_12115 [Chloroflexota bacterium]